MKKTFLILGGLFTFVVLVIGCSIYNFTSWFVDRSVAVIKQQVDPVELQRRYEWLKDAAAQLDAKNSSLGIYKSKINRLRVREDAGKLDRTDREQLMIWEQEMTGVKLSYNDLASEYNSQMSKWNWRFCDVGGLPQGATKVLPREYKPYIEE